MFPEKSSSPRCPSRLGFVVDRVFTLYLALSSLATYLGLLVLMKRPISSTPATKCPRLLLKCMHYKAGERWILLPREEQFERSLLWARVKVFEMQRGEPGAVGTQL